MRPLTLASVILPASSNLEKPIAIVARMLSETSDWNTTKRKPVIRLALQRLVAHMSLVCNIEKTHNILRATEEFSRVHDQQVEYDLQYTHFHIFRNTLNLVEKQLK